MRLLIIISALLFTLPACGQQESSDPSNNKNSTGQDQWNLSEAQWKERLSDEAYLVLREKGTETAFSNAYWDLKTDGEYRCGGCGLPVFSSETKFKSGTGWPSFFRPEYPKNILEVSDTAYGWDRTEVVCSRCGGHLGHVFKDGPKPTGLRYCLNSAALDFKPEE